MHVQCTVHMNDTHNSDVFVVLIIQILEQRESAGNDGLPYEVLDLQPPEQHLLQQQQQDINKTDSPSLGLVQALTAQRPRAAHNHHNLHHLHNHIHHHLSKITQPSHLLPPLTHHPQQQPHTPPHHAATPPPTHPVS